MKTRAPSGGYDSDEKQMYRRWVWSIFKKYLPVHVSKASIVFMPGPSDAELNVARSSGARDANLVAVDHNPANVAVLRRKGFLGQTIGATIEEAFSKRIDAVVHAVHLDLTSEFSDPVARSVSSVVRSGTLADFSVIVVNVQRGRESHSAWDEFEFSLGAFPMSRTGLHSAFYDRLQVADAARCGALALCLSGFGLFGADSFRSEFLPKEIGAYLYRSETSKVSMLACAFLMWPRGSGHDIFKSSPARIRSRFLNSPPALVDRVHRLVASP